MRFAAASGRTAGVRLRKRTLLSVHLTDQPAALAPNRVGLRSEIAAAARASCLAALPRPLVGTCQAGAK